MLLVSVRERSLAHSYWAHMCAQWCACAEGALVLKGTSLHERGQRIKTDLVDWRIVITVAIMYAASAWRLVFRFRTWKSHILIWFVMGDVQEFERVAWAATQKVRHENDLGIKLIDSSRAYMHTLHTHVSMLAFCWCMRVGSMLH